MAQLAEFCFPRHLHHLREQVIQPLGVPPPEFVQGPVIRRGPTGQIAKRQIFAKPLLQPPRTGHAQGVGVQKTETNISGAYACPPSSPYSSRKALRFSLA